MNLIAEFSLEGNPRLYNRGMSIHWTTRGKEAKKWKFLVAYKCRELKINDLNLKKAKITIIRHSCREPDFDGLVSGGKHLLDGLTMAKVIVDDRVSIIGQPIYLWQFRSRGKGGMVTMKIETEEERI